MGTVDNKEKHLKKNLNLSDTVSLKVYSLVKYVEQFLVLTRQKYPSKNLGF